MKTLLENFSAVYYTQVLLLFETIVTACIAYKNRNRFKILRFFLPYSIFSTIQTLESFTGAVLYPEIAWETNSVAVYIFILIEFFVFYNFLFQIIKRKSLKIIMFGLALGFAYTAIRTWWIGSFSSFPLLFIIANSICIFIPCLFYFFEVFKTPALTSLSNLPAFWIVSGFLFMVTCTLPFYLLEGYLSKYIREFYVEAYILNNLFYCLLFLLISKAFLCKPKKYQ